MNFQEFGDSCAHSETSEISKNGLAGILGLLCAEQNVRNLKNIDFQEFWDSCALLLRLSFLAAFAERAAPKCSPKSSQIHRALFWTALGAFLLSFECLAFLFFAFRRFFTGGLGSIIVTVERLSTPVWLPQEGLKRQSFLICRTL